MKTTYEFNPDTAKQVLEDANWDPNQELGILLWPGAVASEAGRAQYAAIQQMLGAVGIKTKFEVVDDAAWSAKYYDKPDDNFTYVGNGSFDDPDGFLRFHMHSAGKNSNGYANPDLEKLIDQGAAEVDQEKRKAIYTQIQDLLNEDVPVAPVYSAIDFYILNRRVYFPAITEGAEVEQIKGANPLPAVREWYYRVNEWGVKA